MSEQQGMVMDVTCAVHRHREWVPIESHHIHPLGLGGANVAANRIAVCANGHYSIHEYMRQLGLRNGRIPWTQARRYGRKVRALAVRGWTEAGKPTKAGSE